MPLAVGQVSLAAALAASWANTSPSQTPPTAATDMANASMSFGQTGIPMTVDTVTVAPGQVIVAVTTTPGTVTGSGIGGIDVPSPGMGLDAAKSILVATLTGIFADTSPANTPVTTANSVATAIMNFLSQAMVMTNINGVSPPGQAAPPPVGPLVPGPWSGSGIGSLESTSGAGLASGLPSLIAALTATFANTTPVQTPASVSADIGDAMLAFYKMAMITCVDNGVAGGGVCAVAPPPLPPTGSTVGPSSGSGTGTGSIV